jgi:hypothetical protein
MIMEIITVKIMEGEEAGINENSYKQKPSHVAVFLCDIT